MGAKLSTLLGFVLLLAVPVSCGTPTQNPKKSQTRLQLAKDFLSRQELASARQEASRALTYDSSNAEAHSILGLVDMMEALNNVRLLEVDNCLTGVDAEGLRDEMQTHLQAARASFARATNIDSGYSEAFANEASALALLDEYDRAIELNTKALGAPHRLLNLGLTRANLGWARFHIGDEVGAAKELRQALQFSPTMCVAKYRLGRVYFKREEWNKALVQFQAVVLDTRCGMQEAHLYLVKTMRQLSMTEPLPNAIVQCTALAPNSCIAAECQVAI